MDTDILGGVQMGVSDCTGPIRDDVTG